MGWARLDDSFHDHPKLIGLSLEALGLWVKCFTWAHRHHGSSEVLGFLPEGLPETFAGSRGRKLGNELVTRRLWDQLDNGWAIHDYADYLPASERPETAQEVRKARSEAGKRGATARWGMANGWQTDSKAMTEVDGKTMPPTRPDPNPIQIATDVAIKHSLESAFDEAYSHWPKKVERKNALDKFRVAARKVGVDQLAAHVVAFGDAYGATTERQFTPALNVWLSHERWTDEMPSPVVATRRPTRTDQNVDFVAQLRAEESQKEIAR